MIKKSTSDHSFYAIVVGGGIPGLYAARELAKAGKRVLLLEQSKEAGDPNYSTAGVPVETLEIFQLPKDGVNCTITQFLFGTKQQQTVKKSLSPVSFVLDFKRMKILIANEVEAAGGTILYGVHAHTFSILDQTYHLSTSQGEYTCEYLIDATGSPGVLMTQAGLREVSPCRLSVGMECIVQGKDGRLGEFDHTLGIYLDTQICPYGYAWVFADGDNQYKIGISEYYLDPARKLPMLNARLEKFIDWIGRDRIGRIIEKHAGSKFMTTHFSKIYERKLVGIGDAIGAINPVYGEGIRHGLYSAKFAVEGILAQDLNVYEQRWKSYMGMRWKKTEFMAHALYNGAGRETQNLYEYLIENTNKYSTAQDMLESGYFYRSKLSFYSLPRQVMMLVKALRAYYSL